MRGRSISSALFTREAAAVWFPVTVTVATCLRLFFGQPGEHKEPQRRVLSGAGAVLRARQSGLVLDDVARHRRHDAHAEPPPSHPWDPGGALDCRADPCARRLLQLIYRWLQLVMCVKSTLQVLTVCTGLHKCAYCIEYIWTLYARHWQCSWRRHVTVR